MMNFSNPATSCFSTTARSPTHFSPVYFAHAVVMQSHKVLWPSAGEQNLPTEVAGQRTSLSSMMPEAPRGTVMTLMNKRHFKGSL